MKRNFLHIALLVLLSSDFVASQTIISYFDWETSPTTALVGPNAVTVSASANVITPGKLGTKGLNPGLPKADLNMEIPGYIFDYGSIDVSIDFQRDENLAEMVTRGSDFQMSMKSGRLFVSYRVQDGLGGYNTYIGNNIYDIPNDNTFRTYQFYYDENLGRADVFVDGVTVWTNTASAQPLFWTATNNVLIGNLADGTGSNRPIFDNFIVKTINQQPLPIELVDFSAEIIGFEKVQVNWKVESELNNDHFILEKSSNGRDFTDIAKIQGRGTASTSKEHSYFDDVPYLPQSFYRLKQVDKDGTTSKSDIIYVKFRDEPDKFAVYPNPFKNTLTVKKGEDCLTFDLYSIDGKLLKSKEQITDTPIDFSEVPNGVYLLVACEEFNPQYRTLIKE